MDKKILLFGALFIALGLLLFTKPGGVTSTPIGLSHYKNEETWDVEWSEDGNRCKVRIHRDAVQS